METKGKKIVIGYDFLKEIGGLERVMFFQANKLNSKFDAELFFGYVDKKNIENVKKSLRLNKDIKIKHFQGINNEIYQLAKTLLNPKRMKNKKMDLMISHSFMFSRIALFNKKSRKTPYIIIINHPPNFLYNSNLKWANNIPRFFAYILGLFIGPWIRKKDIEAVRNADIVTANSKYTARRVTDIYGIKPEILYPVLSEEFKIIDNRSKDKYLKKFGIKKIIYICMEE